MNQQLFDRLTEIRANNDVSCSTDPDMTGAVLTDALGEALRIYKFRDGSFMSPADPLSLAVRELLRLVENAKLVPRHVPGTQQTADQWALSSAKQALVNYANSR